MQFMLMCCIDETHWSALPETTRGEVMQEYDQWVQRQMADGTYRAGGKLDASTAATTVRKPAGKMSVVDGPFAESKEQIGGYHVIECVDRDAALAIAATIPTLSVGASVEVRPLLHQLG